MKKDVVIDLRNRRDNMPCRPHGEASGLVRSQRNLRENMGKNLYSGFPEKVKGKQVTQL